MDSGLPLTQKGYKMATLEKAPTSNFWSTSLNGAINDSVTTITLNSTVGLQAPGRLVINRQDSTGKNTPSAREVISFTGISGSDLTGVTRGADNSTARSHADGSLVESAMVVGNWDALYKVIDQEHNTDGTHDTTLPYYNNSIARQAIINGGFTVNQRVYVSNATLSAGSYGHDRWKAGASGGDYTFTQLPSSTQITIKTGKSLIQVVEDKNVVGGTYTLSWEGTAQARFGINSATPSGSYASSPITITTQTAGTVMSVEFNEGTLGKVQLNSGSIALPFMPKSYEEELRACQRYFVNVCYPSTEVGLLGVGGVRNTTQANIFINFPTTMRVQPSTTPVVSSVNHFQIKTIYGGELAISTMASFTRSNNATNLFITITTTDLFAGDTCFLESTSASAILGWSAEL